MTKTHSGGGMSPTQRPVRTGTGAKGIDPGYASQIGQKLNQKSDRTPERAPMPYSGKLGNAVALEVGKGGPGAGRTVSRSGSQGTHGPVDAGSSPTRRDILSQFGPENSRGGRKI
jgi:hypothetical protein